MIGHKRELRIPRSDIHINMWKECFDFLLEIRKKNMFGGKTLFLCYEIVLKEYTDIKTQRSLYNPTSY